MYVERAVRLAVTASVEAVSLLAARGGVDRRGPAQGSERGDRAQPVRVVAGRSEQRGGVLRADPVDRPQRRRGRRR